jgi:hypothetical protein
MSQALKGIRVIDMTRTFDPLIKSKIVTDFTPRRT